MTQAPKTLSLQAMVDLLTEKGFNPEWRGDLSLVVKRIERLSIAQEGDVSFLSDEKYLKDLSDSQASVVILSHKHADLFPKAAILVDNPYAAYAFIVQKLYAVDEISGIHESAVVADSARISTSACVGANAVIGEGVVIADHAVVGAGCVLESGVKLGIRTRLAPNVTIMNGCQLGEDCIVESGTVIGGDGFGWARHQGQWVKIPQVGRVIIGHRVSIGNNVTIDRGAIEDTVIEDNCIIDNLVHIAHNVKIGSGTAIAGQVGFAGSAVVGKNCTFAGQSGMVGHIELTDGVTIMGRGVATHSIHQSGVYSGFPAVPISEWQKNAIYAKNLAKFSEKIKGLNQRLSKLEKQTNEA